MACEDLNLFVIIIIIIRDYFGVSFPSTNLIFAERLFYLFIYYFRV